MGRIVLALAFCVMGIVRVQAHEVAAWKGETTAVLNGALSSAI